MKACEGVVTGYCEQGMAWSIRTTMELDMIQAAVPRLATIDPNRKYGA